MEISDFIQLEKGNSSVTVEVKPAPGDGYRIVKDNGGFKVFANNERSCLWGIYHVQAGGGEGVFNPRFQIRGINPCESLARHTPEQIESLINRMAHWQMNTLIIHLGYGYKFHTEQTHRLCLERGIDIKFYLQTSLLFLQGADPSFFARNAAGDLHTPSLDNETRLCVSSPEAIETYRKGAKQFFSGDQAQAGSTYILMDADGYLFCQCPKCRNIKPVEQWARLFNIAIEEAEKIEKNLRIEYLSYVWRYSLPTDFSAFKQVKGVMFDTHQRYRWKALNESHPFTPFSQLEAQADSRADGVPLNLYLHDRLLEWRRAYSGPLYVFENLMIQGSMSCPQPNTPQLLQDLDSYQDAEIDGVVYEAFEPGIEGFAAQIEILSKALWSPAEKTTPTSLEKLCTELDGKQDFEFPVYAIPYLVNSHYDALAVVRESGCHPLLYEYMVRLKAFLENRNMTHYRSVITFVMQHRERFDWMLIAFNLARAIPEKNRPWRHPRGQQCRFLEVQKLWDLMEDMSDPIGETTQIIDSLLC